MIWSRSPMMWSTLGFRKTVLMPVCGALMAVGVSTTALVGCAPSSVRTFDSLIDQGLLPLSPDNAYVGSNLFLSQEFGKSSHLFNFLKGRGAPLAIQLRSSRFGNPELSLYYPVEKEMFVAELVQSEKSYQWITRGPFRIERKEYRDLARSTLEIGEPLFVHRGQPFQFKKKPEPTPTPTITPTIRVTPKPRPKTKKPITGETVIPGLPTPTVTPSVWRPLNADQQALLMSQGFAERADNGDVVHTVSSESHTIERIAEWYTGSAANSEGILKANGLSSGSPLSVGARVLIPLALIRQFRALK